MPDRYVSQPLQLPAHDPEADFVRAELQFHGVDHSGLSYEARVFLNQPDADATTERKLAGESGYAGSFHIFGHGGCFGDVGHCDVPGEAREPHDLRLTHPLTPDTKTVIITDALRRLRDQGASELTVTVVAHVYDPAGLPLGRDQAEPLLFESLKLVTYETPPAKAPAASNESSQQRR